MRFTQLGAATALVAATCTQAFLLPPTITEADSDIVNTLPFEDAIGIKDRVMELNCPGCPVVIADIDGHKHFTFSPVESVLLLNFSLQDNDQLLLNGIPVYPVDIQSPTFMEPLTADQLVKSPADTWEYAATPKLGYSLAVGHPAKGSNNEQLDLVSVKLEILEVADKFVHGMPTVELKLLETPSGKLMIGSAEIQSAPSRVSAPTDSDKECTTTICKWRAIIADKLSKIKGCAGRKGRPGSHGKHGSGVRPHGHGRPRPQGPHRPHRHHHRRGGFARFLRSIVLHVFIPIMIGVVVGVTTSLIGMIVGHFIVFIWRFFFRRRQHGQYRRVQQEVAVEGDDEAKSSLEQQGPPPTYEEAPAYEAVVVDEKASE
jgi:hypothetical protein